MQCCDIIPKAYLNIGDNPKIYLKSMKPWKSQRKNSGVNNIQPEMVKVHFDSKIVQPLLTDKSREKKYHDDLKRAIVIWGIVHVRE